MFLVRQPGGVGLVFLSAAALARLSHLAAQAVDVTLQGLDTLPIGRISSKPAQLFFAWG